jgi:hypothetical protein
MSTSRKIVPGRNWESDITATKQHPARGVAVAPLPSSALFHPVSTNMNSAAVPLPPVFHTVDEMYPLEGEDLKEIQSRYPFHFFKSFLHLALPSIHLVPFIHSFMTQFGFLAGTRI